MTARSRLIGAAAWIFKMFDDRAGGLSLPRRMADARTFLVLRYDTALGSAINSTVLFEAMRRLKPDAHIAVACDRLCFEVLKGNPFIDEFIVTADPRTHFARAALEAVTGVRRGRRRFDCVITSCNDRPSIEALALLLGRGLRIGHGPDRSFHIALGDDGNASVIAEHLRVARLFGEIAATPVPRVYCAASDIVSVRARLAAGGWDGSRPLFVFTSRGSGGQPTDWYDDRFVALADRLAERYGAGIVFTGTAVQAAVIDGIRSAMRNPSISVAGRISIAELSALISIGDLMVTLDTGSMHLARGWGTPMVVIASAWQPAHRWLQPLVGERVEILRRDHVPCALCGKSYCATRECLDEITTDDVFGAAARMLEKFPPGTSHPISPNGRQSPGDPETVQIQPT